MTPLQIQILLKLYYLSDPNQAFDHGILPEVEFIDTLENVGIVSRVHGSLTVDNKALELYVNQLKKIPLPHKEWKI